MKHIPFVLLCAVGVLSNGGLARAQDAPQGPAKILQIFREEVKPGRSAAHERLEAGYARAFKAARRAPYLAMSTIAGPSEAWFLVRFDSYAAMEAENDAVEKDSTLTQALGQLDEADAAFRAGQRAMIGESREDLSYRPLENIGGVRYVDVIIFRVRPGQVPTFEEARAISKKAHEQAKVDEHWAVYEIGSGMPAGTFLMLFGYKSARRTRHPAPQRRLSRRARLGGPREGPEADWRLGAVDGDDDVQVQPENELSPGVADQGRP